MPQNRKHRSSPGAGRWASLTWDDLENWAGNRSMTRGRTYQRQGCVHDLAISPEGRLLATVEGSESYATSVWLVSDQDDDQEEDEGPVRSRCTCPVGYDGCKHAVAVTAEYLQCLADKVEVDVADVDDPRWSMASAWDEASSSRERQPDRAWDDKIRQHIESKSREELIDLVGSLTQRFPELHEELTERLMLKEGNVDHLVTEARRELRTITAQPGWRNHWDNEGWIPDYSRLNHRLDRLVELGHCDAVAKLGSEILDCGLEQVSQSDDEGETGIALVECLSIVFGAVARSSLSASEKLLFAVDAYLKDDYDIIDDAADAVLDAQYTPADWSEVADDLTHRLETMGKNTVDDFSYKYLRDHITGWLARALEAAGRGDEVLPIYEREARITNSYQRLVRFLMDQKRYDEAELWMKEGIEKTRGKWPGIASGLAGMMSELAHRRGREDIVASHAALRFFAQPSRHAFEELAAAASKIKDKGNGRSTGRPNHRPKPAKPRQTALLARQINGIDGSVSIDLPVGYHAAVELNLRRIEIDRV